MSEVDMCTTRHVPYRKLSEWTTSCWSTRRLWSCDLRKHLEMRRRIQPPNMDASSSKCTERHQSIPSPALCKTTNAFATHLR